MRVGKRRYSHVAGARSWIWISASAAGFLIGWFAAVAVPSASPQAHFLGGAAFCLAYSVATGPMVAGFTRFNDV
ncbi:MAG: hypothetical protein ACR2NO_05065 [Chloroflexota bacterium]